MTSIQPPPNDYPFGRLAFSTLNTTLMQHGGAPFSPPPHRLVLSPLSPPPAQFSSQKISQPPPSLPPDERPTRWHTPQRWGSQSRFSLSRRTWRRSWRSAARKTPRVGTPSRTPAASGPPPRRTAGSAASARTKSLQDSFVHSLVCFFPRQAGEVKRWADGRR